MPRTSTTPPTRQHFVVDGSNIATEGRAMPSLDQLNEAVLAFIDEHPTALITVVVDATFGHRIDKNEVATFDAAVANNELVTPPAGAVGRGDAFVLTIAHKAKAGILSNDSFQEFHGDYPWLFESGRLIGGKPVPHVGWVFVERLPVRGPKSRLSVKEAKGRSGKSSEGRARGSGSPLADQPMPVPTAPPPGVGAPKPKRNEPVQQPDPATERPAATGSKPVNDLLPFLEFAEKHPVGTSCTVVVESYASHGAYARSGDVLVYLPLRLMGNPMPRSARAAVAIGEAIAVVVAGYVPDRRSIDAALPSAADNLAAAPEPEAAPRPKTPRKQSARKSAAAVEGDETVEPSTSEPAATAPKRGRARKPAPAGAPESAPAGDAAVEPQPDPVVEPDSSTAPAKPGRRSRKAAAQTASSDTESQPEAAAAPRKRAASKRSTADDAKPAAAAPTRKRAATRKPAKAEPAKIETAKAETAKAEPVKASKAAKSTKSAAKPKPAKR